MGSKVKLRNVKLAEKVKNLGVNIGQDIVSTIKRSVVGGMIGGTIYGLTWGELSNLLNVVLKLSIGNFPNFSDKMYGYMFRLMVINKEERNKTLNMIGANAYDGGNPDGMPVFANMPDYAIKTNDYYDFVNTVGSYENIGWNSTSVNTVDEEERITTTNLYPDDLGIGTFDNVWNASNRNSILAKTKKLFEQHKINSLISRFGTNADGEGDIDYNGKVGYDGIGSSRGKNLKRAPDDKGSTNYGVNGYNNPYCRVWTHHHQYDRYSRSIRPFDTSTVKNFGNFNGVPMLAVIGDSKQETMRKLHTWNNDFFEFNEGAINEGKDGEWGWKHENSEWVHSVLSQQDGLVNIAPKYNDKGTIHTKDCMFSIENLAWKDYNPYEFENALSWEQRGPLGGRIMWFPPYGISFTENTNVQWNENVFIGRGENVYTYSNTTRSGTLSFMMLTDHPSVTDYATWWNDEDNHADDDDWNRFFAGCDSLDPNSQYSIMHYVMPTPMDYIFEEKPATPQETEPDEPVPNEDETPSDSVEEVTFFTFFPNYYTGQESKLFNADATGVCDFSIAYLLGGLNAQKANFSQFDEQISFNFSESTAFRRGYEMTQGGDGITDLSTTENQNNRIIGNKFNWRNIPDDQLQNYTYEEEPNRKWYYRIDGKYEFPKNHREKLTNQYSHILATPDSYKDTHSYGLNLSVNNLDNELCPNKENVYSFAEFAYAMATYQPNCEGVSEYLSDKISQGRLEEVENLSKMLENKIDEITITGYANSQGYADENELLAMNRAQTIYDWLLWFNSDSSIKRTKEKQVVNVSTTDENSLDAKKWRCAKCTIRFSTATTENTNNTEDFEKVSKERVVQISQDTNLTQSQIVSELQRNGFFENSEDLFNYSVADQNKMYEMLQKEKSRATEGKTTGLNKIRYDNEMFFYKKFQKDFPFKWQTLNKKLQYFDPAFHSMTPEGFNMRCTFLQQCTRQGDTMSASDKSGVRTASNMAFGRPPFCVLRLGDFFNQLIVIKSLNIAYDDDGALTWDLNDEGIGAQPMIAKVTIGFDFIGGSDLAGPVRRLQNAMSFNYYANTSLYDNRADRMYYEAEEHLSTAMGGAGNDKPSLPHVGTNGKILDKKGTYSVLHNISKDNNLTE